MSSFCPDTWTKNPRIDFDSVSVYIFRIVISSLYLGTYYNKCLCFVFQEVENSTSIPHSTLWDPDISIIDNKIPINKITQSR